VSATTGSSRSCEGKNLIERFVNIRTHPGTRHKPLLLLLALSRVQHGESQFISYADAVIGQEAHADVGR